MKSQKIFKLAALVLSLVFCFGIFAACAPSQTNTPGESNQPGEDTNNTTLPTDTLVVGYDRFRQNFSPFFSTQATDSDVVNMTGISPMVTDRDGEIIWHGIEGETKPYNGTDYTYYAPADLDMQKGENETVYTIKLRDDMVFSDGEPVTIDDYIFTMYVILDPYYSGATTLSSVHVQGYEAYRYNSTLAPEVSGVVNGWISNMGSNPELRQWVIDTIIAPTLAEEQEWVEAMYADPENEAPVGTTYNVYVNPESDKYMENHNELFVKIYVDERDRANFDLNVSAEDMLQALIDYYTADNTAQYQKLGAKYAGTATFFSQGVEDHAYEMAMAAYEGEVEDKEVPNVSGIKKIDDYTVEVTCDGFMANAVYQVCGLAVNPMHYYGDPAMWDYENNQFGFENRVDGNMRLLMGDENVKSQNPVGAGPYKFVEYDGTAVYFEANENYYLGKPVIPYVQFKETPTADLIAGVGSGTIDVANPTGSLDVMKEIASYNSNGEETGDVITSVQALYLGYGYIGLNANTMKVGGDPGSEASKNLRKGFATVLASKRALSFDSYYGDAAEVIQYPISNTSWAAPKPSDPNYREAFSVDVNNNPIYTDGMTDEAKFAAALEAAKGFFEAAGFTWSDAEGKFVEAPEGAKLDYEIIVAGNGGGNHPSYNVAVDASKELEKIGITLNINDPSDQNVMWDALDAGTQEMWCAAWSSTLDPDMYQVYHSDNVLRIFGGAANSTESNKYGMADDQLDELIMQGRTSDNNEYRKTIYKQALDRVMDWAVEVPCYQRQDLTIFNTQRVNISTITPDITTFWTWMSGIDEMELNH